MMAQANLDITVKVVFWFWREEYGFFTVDKCGEELEGVVHQQIAMAYGWA